MQVNPSINIKDTISAVIIVRDEEQYIGRCLESIKGVVDQIVVIDTGSKDNTVAIAASFGVDIHFFKWTGSFSEARNFGIKRATGQYILSIDGDEWLVNKSQARSLFKEFMLTDTGENIGTVLLINLTGAELEQEISKHTICRFFQKKYFCYDGIIHEQLINLKKRLCTNISTGVKLHHAGYARNHKDIEKKWKRNEQQLQRAITEDKKNEYLVFQLGKTYFVQKDYKAAGIELEKAMDLINWSVTPPQGKSGSVSDEVLVDLLCTLAYSYVNTGNLDAALKLLSNHLSQDHGANRYADLPHALGYVHLLRGDISDAKAAYFRSLQLGENCEQVSGTGSYASHFHLGLLSEFSGDRKGAVEYYRKALQINPNYGPALTQLKTPLGG